MFPNTLAQLLVRETHSLSNRLTKANANVWKNYIGCSDEKDVAYNAYIADKADISDLADIAGVAYIIDIVDVSDIAYTSDITLYVLIQNI